MNNELSPFIKKLLQYKPLTPEEEKEIYERIKKGDRQALKRLIEGHIRFVIKYASRFVGYGVPFEDLVEEGILGLIEAAKRFDPNRNVKFLSYAGWWIREAILNALHHGSRAVEIPRRMMHHYLKLKRKSRELRNRFGRTPTVEELARELDMDEEKVGKLMMIKNNDLSLSSQYRDEELTLGAIIPEQEEDVADRVFRKKLREKIMSAVDSLSERQAKILKLRFGLEDGVPRTLEEVGKAMGLSKERVRQLEMKALRELRRNEVLRSIRGSLN